jgi:Reverse transcriptase (RNA-dependent DNA polymerase).
VELPAEAEVQDDECGKLIHWLYGCRPAAQAWEEHYSALLQGNGFKRLQTVPVAFINEEKDLSGVVHGDDFVWEGRDEDLDWVLNLLEKEYELKNRGRLGFGPKDVRKIDILGRVIELSEEGITWKGDPRHQDLLEEHFGMNGDTKVLTKNGYDDGPQDTDDPEEELSSEECKVFRMLAARLNYMAQDNSWLQFAAKEICRNMAKPKRYDFPESEEGGEVPEGRGRSEAAVRVAERGGGQEHHGVCG